MKLTFTTAIAAALIATGAIAGSRGADNETGSEVAAEPTLNDTTRTQAEINAEDTASRGADNLTGEEAAENPLIDDDEVAGTKTDKDESSRGANNTTGSEMADDEEKADG